jgi:hypothetical protein
MRITNMEIQSDSQIIIGQINGGFAAQWDKMTRYLDKVRQFQCYFDRIVLTKIPREENSTTYALSRIGSGTDQAAPVNSYRVLVRTQPTVSTTTELMQVDEVEPEWATGIIRYLKHGELHPVKEEAREVIRCSARYVQIGGVLCRRGYSFPLLKCLSEPDADYVLRKIHEGLCRNRSRAKMLVNKVIRTGYYWLTMNKDAANIVRTCDACQRFARIMKNPPEHLHPIISPWPFAKWGVDIVGLISLELFDSRPLHLHLLDLVLVVYITCCCSFCVLSYFQVLIGIQFKTPELDLKIHQGRFGHFQSLK